MKSWLQSRNPIVRACHLHEYPVCLPARLREKLSEKSFLSVNMVFPAMAVFKFHVTNVVVFDMSHEVC